MAGVSRIDIEGAGSGRSACGAPYWVKLIR